MGIIIKTSKDGVNWFPVNSGGNIYSNEAVCIAIDNGHNITNIAFHVNIGSGTHVYDLSTPASTCTFTAEEFGEHIDNYVGISSMTVFTDGYDSFDITFYYGEPHTQVYGICGNKCKVEVIPKENFLVIEGTMKNVSTEGTLATIFKADVGVESFMNYAVLSHQLKWGNEWRTFGEVSSNYVVPNTLITDGTLWISVYHNKSTAIDVDYRVVLLKVK